MTDTDSTQSGPLKPVPDMWKDNPDVYRAPDGRLMSHRHGEMMEGQTFRDKKEANRTRNTPRRPPRPMSPAQMVYAYSLKCHEALARLRAGCRERGHKPPTPNKVQRGWGGKARSKLRKQIHAEVAVKAREFVSRLKELGLFNETGNLKEDALAEQALVAAAELALDKETVANKDRMTAINTILTYTKVKPESKSKVTVQTAEDYLNSLLEPGE